MTTYVLLVRKFSSNFIPSCISIPMYGITYFQLPIRPHLPSYPLLPTHSMYTESMIIIIELGKRILKSSSYELALSTYAVNLLSVAQEIKKLHCPEYLKMTFLEIQNFLLCRRFANQVAF